MSNVTSVIDVRIHDLDQSVAAASPAQRRTLLMAALEDEETRYREHAIDLAARNLEPEVLGVLLGNDENAVLRNSAIVALEKQGANAVPHLVELSRSPNVEVAMFAVQVLARIPDASSADALLPLIEHADTNVAQAAVEALGNMRSRQAVPGLIRLLRADLWLQFAAVAALGEIGDERAVEPLLLAIDNELLADVAAEGLGRLGAASSLAPLADRLIAIDRLPLRDHLLGAVAAVLERHAIGPAVLAELATRVRAADAAGLHDYLRGLLRGQDRKLARAAATLVAASAMGSLLSEVLLRGRDDDDDSELRWTAALLERFAGVVGDVLIGLVSAPDARVRVAALQCGAFPRRADALAEVTRSLDDPERGVRAAACHALGAIADPTTVPLLVERLVHGQSEERHAAAEALGHMPAEALASLSRCLVDPGADEIVIAALGALEAARCAVLAEDARRLSGAGSPSVRRSAIRVLSHAPGAETEKVLLERLADSDEGVRVEAVEALVALAAPGAQAALTGQLAIADGLRYYAIRALGRLRTRAAVAPLAELFPTAKVHERIEIVAALGRIGGADVLSFLDQRLHERDRELRRAAADGVARLGLAEAFPILARLTEDEDWTIRNFAGWGLGELRKSEARPALEKLTHDTEPVVARTARAALAKLPRDGGGKTR